MRSAYKTIDLRSHGGVYFQATIIVPVSIEFHIPVVDPGIANLQRHGLLVFFQALHIEINKVATILLEGQSDDDSGVDELGGDRSDSSP